MTDLPKLLKERQMHSRMFAVGVVLLVLFCRPLLPLRSFSGQLMVWIGYALVIAGAMGRIYCSLFIGGRKNNAVVRDGPFSVVRNPLYVFSFLAMVGCGLQTGMLTVTVLLIAAFALYYPQVVAKEEQFLSHKFGEAYEAYKREVPRWEPDFKLWRQPEEVAVKPEFVYKTIKDAAVFFLPLPLLSVLHTLQGRKILAAWLQLP